MRTAGEGEAAGTSGSSGEKQHIKRTICYPRPHSSLPFSLSVLLFPPTICLYALSRSLLPSPTVNLLYTRSVAWCHFSGGHFDMGQPGTPDSTATFYSIVFHNDSSPAILMRNCDPLHLCKCVWNLSCTRC